MIKLEFKTPIFREGLNVTVRRGRKWSKSKGKIVNLIGNGKSYGSAIIVKTYMCPFYQLCGYDLRFEHDPSCHDILGLLNAMKRAYSDFKQSDECCVVQFRRLK